MSKAKILVVDDEPAILRIVEDFLSDRFNVVVAANAQEAIALVIEEKPNLIIIDNIMPGMSGVELAKTLRRAPSVNQVPIIMLTALKESSDRIEAFKAGVDDFISKPFDLDELMARVESKLVRFGSVPHAHSEVWKLGNLSIDEKSHQVKIKEKTIHLTHIEFAILLKLIESQNQIVSRDELEKTIWKSKKTENRILDIHLNTLRKKIQNFDHQIETIYGRGFIIRSRDI